MHGYKRGDHVIANGTPGVLLDRAPEAYDIGPKGGERAVPRWWVSGQTRAYRVDELTPAPVETGLLV